LLCPADKLRRNERQPEAWLALPVIELLALSCPQPPWLPGPLSSVTPSASAGVSHETRSLCFQPGKKPRLDYSLHKYVATLDSTKSDAVLPFPFFDGLRCLIVEDLQNGRELERSTRFAPRNRKNRVNIGLSALRQAR